MAEAQKEIYKEGGEQPTTEPELPLRWKDISKDGGTRVYECHRYGVCRRYDVSKAHFLIKCPNLVPKCCKPDPN